MDCIVTENGGYIQTNEILQPIGLEPLEIKFKKLKKVFQAKKT